MTAPATLLPVEYDAPLVNPSGTGLYPATNWTDEAAPNRWLASGVHVRTHNYGGEAAFGVWTADWCANPDDLTDKDIKTGTRPANDDPFLASTVWAYDACDNTAPSRAEVDTRVQQNLRLVEQTAYEREFGSFLLSKAGTVGAAVELVKAVGKLEAAFAKTNTVGLIHASAELAAPLAAAQQIVRSGTGLRSPLGHLWVFGGGYVDALGDTLVATSPTYGWRSEVVSRSALVTRQDTSYAVVAERSVLVAYEKLIGAAKVA